MEYDFDDEQTFKSPMNLVQKAKDYFSKIIWERLAVVTILILTALIVTLHLLNIVYKFI